MISATIIIAHVVNCIVVRGDLRENKRAGKKSQKTRKLMLAKASNKRINATVALITE